eukprot:CAMPEP_0115845364 /NCGR_PEP_ID=MMETSP0287-20121206/9315_1 /TAXON_ID=412157 /ORGANISM="Chrysochromulina rotalis, Strain UIO044" /LENGTH=222 /DNA_ID=CAMNT_0003299137 /DNA_START=181 /DNA_END=849 /DNA_ORIENTATION=+
MPEDATVQEWGVQLLQTLYKQSAGPHALGTKKDILRAAATIIKVHPKRTYPCLQFSLQLIWFVLSDRECAIDSSPDAMSCKRECIDELDVPMLVLRTMQQHKCTDYKLSWLHMFSYHVLYHLASCLPPAMAKQILNQVDRPPSIMEKHLSSIFADIREKSLYQLRLASADTLGLTCNSRTGGQTDEDTSAPIAGGREAREQTTPDGGGMHNGRGMGKRKMRD